MAYSVYYESIGILCDCEYNDKNELINSLCNHCHLREEKQKSKPWYIEVKTISKYLKLQELTSNIEDRMVIMKDMFEYIMTCTKFMAQNPKFRITASLKIKEFREDPRSSSIKHILDKTNDFIENLKNVEGFKN
jgi:hypothetical protein